MRTSIPRWMKEFEKDKFSHRTFCPKCGSINCHIWRVLESFKFTPEEAQTYMDHFHPEDGRISETDI